MLQMMRRVSSFFITPPPAPEVDDDDDLPSWDPQTPFCYPVKDIPATSKIPTNLSLADFTNVVHLADGSNANCYTATYKGQTVVIKMIQQAKEHNDVTDHEFLHEHGMLARLDHPNIVKVGLMPPLLLLSSSSLFSHPTCCGCVDLGCGRVSPALLGAGAPGGRHLGRRPGGQQVQTTHFPVRRRAVPPEGAGVGARLSPSLPPGRHHHPPRLEGTVLIPLLVR
jgi:hypothetical protein